MQPLKDIKETDAWKEKLLSERFTRDPDKTLAIDQANHELLILLDQYEWFYDSIVEGAHICVYVNYMDKVVLSTIPNILYGYPITIGFTNFLLCEEKYNTTLSLEELKNGGRVVHSK
jgi:hypothetical protein